jgi:predicted small metal-binding protein
MVKFARCNALLSLALDSTGRGCRYVAKGDTDDEVITDMSSHMTSVHQVAGSDMVENIRGAMKQTRT